MAALRDRFKRSRCVWLKRGLLCWLLLLIAFFAAQVDIAVPEDRAERELYKQATAAMLEREFPSSGVEYLLMDARSGDILAMRWNHTENPIPPGSLLKPFLALAYEHSHPSEAPLKSAGQASFNGFPKLHCHGKADGCWRVGGHGLVGLERALAVSCNAYFLALARDLIVAQGDALRDVSSAYGLPSPPGEKTASMLIGATAEWRIPPVALTRAYAMLMSTTSTRDTIGTEPHAEEAAFRLREGMRMAALPGGTAARVGIHPGGVLAKTGTAPCVPDSIEEALEGSVVHPRCRINGDGLAMLVAPAENPRWVLLVRQRGTTGAVSAELAGKMLSRLEESDGTRR